MKILNVRNQKFEDAVVDVKTNTHVKIKYVKNLVKHHKKDIDLVKAL